ncbi:sensor histidine kinase [Psychrobacter glacincola]|uniref:sensor histidine kinase n=1 Tax=Psychrobacter glacincola TaxID=56810 RepID=UPI0039B03EFE
MNNRPPQTLSTLIWQSILQTIILAVSAGLFVSFVYGFVQYYKETRQHIQEIATLLTISASIAENTDVVDEQIQFLLEKEPSIESILFYTTSQPVVDANQLRYDWKNALFANSISLNYPVVGDPTNKILSSKEDTLVGYLNVTVDIAMLREDWIKSNLLLWLMTTLLAIIWALFILRKLNWPSKDVATLSAACDIVIKNPELERLPMIQQRFEFQELIRINQAFITIFERLQVAKQDYQALAALEKQLHHKDLSLDVQLRNFQSMITHELKTSLNAIVGGLQLLDDERLSHEQKDAIDIIHNGSDKLVLTLDQIIQLNQIQKGQISLQIHEFNPLQLIADLLADFEPIAKQKGLVLISHIHHIDYVLEGDAARIKQILSILINNAIKFTPTGQVSITSQLTHFNNSNRWQIGVADTGIGIDSSFIDDIFNPFFQVDSSKTRQYEGSGIGLPVVKQMAQLMAASVEVDSSLGVGTNFTVTIPMANQRQSEQQQDLRGLKLIYYYYHEKGSLVDELQRLGADVVCYQNEQVVVDEISTKKFDILMFAEDVFSRKAALLASRIRALETESRTLMVFWYPQQQIHDLASFEFGLKVAGVDYCEVAKYEGKALNDLLKYWLGWI